MDASEEYSARRRVAVWVAAAVAAFLAVAVIGAVTWYFYPREVPSSGWPSVAVLPFVNQSGDEDQDYFSNGLTDDLLTNLARIPHLTVLSRNATAHADVLFSLPGMHSFHLWTDVPPPTSICSSVVCRWCDSATAPEPCAARMPSRL